ncbi:MAG: polysaccharide biosynthesis/export family protein [Paracoccaceae bacterium]
MEPVDSIGDTPADPVAQEEEVDLPEGEASEDDFYEIRVGDTLTVSVLEDPNLTRTVFVRPDGRISLPIAGSVRVAGVSPEELETILAERYSRGFQITPTVTVSIRGIAPLQGGQAQGPAPTTFYMLGSVGQRGPIAVPGGVTVLEALAIAGGPTPFAATDRIQIRRFDEDGVEEILLFDYERVEDGLPVENNFEIVEGDVIYVPERGLFD